MAAIGDILSSFLRKMRPFFTHLFNTYTDDISSLKKKREVTTIVIIIACTYYNSY